MKVLRTSEIFSDTFKPVHRAARNPDILNIVCKGGRGSGKSSAISLELVYQIMKHPVNGLVVRFTANSLQNSVYEQIKWAIEELGVSHLFKCTLSPLKITYLPRGNYIVFRGGQDSERLKSLKDAKFPFTLLWIEELAEFKNEDQVTMITNSMLRGELENGLQYKFFFSYNPPKRKQSWVNKKYEPTSQPKNTLVIKSDYRTNPHISKSFIEEAEATKDRNEMRYRWEYLGEAIGSGVVPFDNLEVKEGIITPDMLAEFDNYRLGLDFGYATDPLAFVVWHYDKKRRTIYAIDELYRVKCSNRECAEWLKKRGYANDTIYCDSAEPKSIAELRNLGIRQATKAIKGKDSVEFGERWLDDLDRIVIDPKRTPKIAWEFENIDYATDKDGNVKPRLEDKDNHAIDATRYAFSMDMRQGGGVKLFKGGL